MKAIETIHAGKRIRMSLLPQLAAYYFLLVTCPVMGQVLQKKMLTEADYGKWGLLTSHSISDLGDWVRYGMQYDTVDTLFVVSAKTGKKYAFRNGILGEFNGEGWFACKQHDTLVLQNLQSGKVSYFPKITNFSFSGDGKFTLLFAAANDGTQILKIRDNSGKIVASAENIREWTWNENKTALAVVSGKETVEIMQVGNLFNKTRIPLVTAGNIKSLAWQNNTIAFIDVEAANEKIYTYNVNKKTLRFLDAKANPDFPKGLSIATGFNALKISNDGRRVFFKVKEAVAAAAKPEIVQVWNANDKQLYPNAKMYGDYPTQDKAAVWFIDTGRFLQINTKEQPSAGISLAGNYALVWDALAYEPQWDYEGPRDIFAVNLQTGQRKMILKAYPGTAETPLIAPSGNYMTYAKNGHWWVYDFRKDNHINITADLGVPFHNIEYDQAGEIPLYGIGGWNVNDQSLFVYDQFDIWKMTPDGLKRIRLTDGRKSKTTFRLEALRQKERANAHGNYKTPGIFDASKNLVLSASTRAGGYNGFYTLDAKKGLKPIIWEYKKIDRFAKAMHSDTYIMISQRFDEPPQIRVVKSGEKPTVLYQSNPHHKIYFCGMAEKIKYMADGKQLSGVLIYPADYNPTKTYPMVVNIYERQWFTLHEYVNPTLYNEGGINFSNLSCKGYFVLLPDIAYEMREMGESAKKCVLAAVDAALLSANIDPKKIALTGHSFGGYETDYIITKTDRFAAAVSGAALTDLVFSYLYLSGTSSRADFWRFEHQQQRMERSLFEEIPSYLKNSPVLQAEGVTTPLLSWTGEEDRHVHYLQSIEFYLALRRLGKEHTLLIYPGEEHVILDKEKQADLTHKIEAWLAKYLK